MASRPVIARSLVLIVACVAATVGVSAAGRDAWTTAVLTGRCDRTSVAASRRAAPTADAKALERLALAYARGCGVDQDMFAAGRYYARALARGANDDFARGYVAYVGAGRPRNRADAERAFVRAADAGDPFAPNALAALYVTEQPPDDVRSYRYYALGASRGDELARATQGNELYYGFGAPADRVRGLALLRAASNANADYLLGNLYLSGPDTALRDVRRGLALLREGVARGSASACYSLAQYEIASGDAAAFRANGLALLAKASRAVPTIAADVELGYALIEGFGVRKDVARGVGLYRDAAAQGDVDSEYFIANATFLGRYGIASDPVRGIRLYVAAANAGSANAKRDLAIIRTPVVANATDGDGSPWDDDPTGEKFADWQRTHPMGTMPLPGSPAYPAALPLPASAPQ